MKSDPGERTVLFHRDYRVFSGGHLKVWHYFNHVRVSPEFSPRIWFTSNSVKEGNPWLGAKEVCSHWEPHRADVLFLAGLDWEALAPDLRRNPPCPVLNLIQGVRHASPGDPRLPFLSHRAVRICVSEPVAKAITATGIVNGPVFTIPAGLSREELGLAVATDLPSCDVFIAAAKNPEFGHHLADHLRRSGQRIDIANRYLPREQFLTRMARSRVAVTLPLKAEGFFLPALEAMALGRITVCPDCVGNRHFCRDGLNSFLPRYNIGAVTDAVGKALHLDTKAYNRLVSEANRTVEAHDLDRERLAFLDILERVDEIW